MSKKEKAHQYILPNGLPWYSVYWSKSDQKKARQKHQSTK